MKTPVPLYPMIGTLTVNSQCVKVSSNSQNRHILITGTSGSGKTVALQSIEQDICRRGGNLLVFDFNGSHSSWFDDACYKLENRIMIKREGFPFSFLQNSPTLNGEALIETLVNIFSGIAHFGVQQEMIIYKALSVAQYYKSMHPEMADFSLIKNALIQTSGNAAYPLIAHMRVFFTVKTASNYIIRPGRINVLDFSGFDGNSQIQLANFCLAFIWQRFLTENVKSHLPLFISLDEFQNLDFSSKGTLPDILREGRKFNLHLLLATQSLSSFSKKERTILNQPATKLHLHPDDSDLKILRGTFNGISSVTAEKMLKSLPVGHCLASGTFDIGAQTIQKSLHIVLGAKYT